MKRNNTFKYISVYLLSLLFFFTLSSQAFAQDFTVSGTVKDAETGEGIPGVSIVEDGTTNGTVTDIDGNFTIVTSSESAMLEISYIGYETVFIPVNGQTNIEVVLQISAEGLDEVVVVGYGTQKKKVVTGSISSVDSEDISSTPIFRADQALQGRMAGVNVTNQSGQPGETPSIIIRGIGSSKNTEPLYVVDGMPVEDISFLNSGDIESIDVLKDAASSAIYGARGANGVVLITTKKGTKGKATISYNGYYGIQNVSSKIDMLNAQQYKELMNDGARNANQDEPFDLNEISEYDTDWQNELFSKNVPIQNHEISISGGNDKSLYQSSLSYFSQDGIIGGNKSNFERYTGRVYAESKVKDWLKFGINLNYSHIKKRGITSNVEFNGVYNSALNIDPLTPVFITDEDILNNPPYSDQPVVTDGDDNVYAISDWVSPAEVVNPLALLELEKQKDRIDRVFGNAFAEFTIMEGLKFKSTFSIDYQYTIVDDYKPFYYLNGPQSNVEADGYMSLSKDIYRDYKWQNENFLTYMKTIGDHNFTILLGTSASYETYESLLAYNVGISELLPYFDLATQDTLSTVGGEGDHVAWLSQFGRILYDYKGKYAFTGIIRRDGSTKFGPKNRYGIFPSVGVSWAISDEAFFPKSRKIDYVKLRFSWGINGNDEIGNWQFLPVMDPNRSYVFGGGIQSGTSPAFVANPDLGWEQSEQLDFAVDVSALGGRLTGTVDYYIKTTHDLLELEIIPGHVGAPASIANVGSVQNNGLELSVNWRQMVNDDLSYSLGINGAFNKNEMTEINNEENILIGANWSVLGPVTRAEEGLPLPIFFGYKTDGIFQSEAEVFQHIGSTGEVLQPQAVPGDVRFVDYNDDGILNDDDRTNLGSPIPDFTLGFNGSVAYKGFDLSVFMSGSFGQQIFNGSQRQDISFTNRTAEILDRWTPENPSNEVPRYTFSDVNNNTRISDLYIENASFLRVKNLQLGYTIPMNILDRIQATKWRFYVSVENLYTITKYKGADPEIGGVYDFETGTFSIFNYGIDRGIYPQARTIRFGTSLTF